jgi:hypothetical protein
VAALAAVGIAIVDRIFPFHAAPIGVSIGYIAGKFMTFRPRLARIARSHQEIGRNVEHEQETNERH